MGFSRFCVVIIFLSILSLSLVNAYNYTDYEDGPLFQTSVNASYFSGIGLLQYRLANSLFLNCDQNCTQSDGTIDLKDTFPILGGDNKARIYDGVYWEENAGWNISTGGLYFDGSSGIFAFPSDQVPPSGDDSNVSFFISFKSTNTSGLRTLFSYNHSVDDFFTVYTNESSLMVAYNSFSTGASGKNNNTINTTFVIDEGQPYVFAIEEAAQAGGLLNTSVTYHLYDGVTFKNFSASIGNKVSSSGNAIMGAKKEASGFTNYFQGYIDYFSYYSKESGAVIDGAEDGFYNPGMRQSYMMNPSEWWAFTGGYTYSAIFNVSDENGSSDASLWQSINITKASYWNGSGDVALSPDGYPNESNLFVFGVGDDCSNISFAQANIASTRVGSVHYFNQNVVGECLKLGLVYDSQKTDTLILKNYSVFANTLFNPKIDSFTMNSSVDLGGTISAEANISVEGGNTVILNYTWYVNGVENKSQAIRDLSNTSTNSSSFLQTLGFHGNEFINLTIFANIDNIEQTQTSTQSLTFTLPAYKPNTSLSSPNDGQEINFTGDSTLQNITCVSTDDTLLRNVSLYITNASNQSFSFNQSSSLSGINNSSTWSLNLSAGNYTWNCLTWDAASEEKFADQNYTFSLSIISEQSPGEETSSPSSSGGGGGGGGSSRRSSVDVEVTNETSNLRLQELLESSNESSEDVSESFTLSPEFEEESYNSTEDPLVAFTDGGETNTSRDLITGLMVGISDSLPRGGIVVLVFFCLITLISVGFVLRKYAFTPEDISLNDLDAYVLKNLSEGISGGEIKKNLRNVGWDDSEIKESFARVKDEKKLKDF